MRACTTTSQFSTNATADKILVYDEAGEILDTRRLSIHRAGGDVNAGLAAFESQQRQWLEGRRAFEALWEYGDALVYGIVNAGGAGLEHFGPICLVMADPTAPPPYALAVFPGNSADRYMTEDGAFDHQRCLADATSWTQRAELAVVCCQDVATTTEPHRWPEVLCGDDHYLEAPRAGAVPLECLAEVRLLLEERDEMADLRARKLLGEELKPTDDTRVLAYDALHEWRRERGIPMRVLS